MDCMSIDFDLPAGSDRAALCRDILDRVKAGGVETVRLSFADQHGLLRGKTIPVSGLEAALSGGLAMTSTLLLKDTSHKTVFPVWGPEGGYDLPGMKGAGDVLMLPDPATFRILPWADKTGWLLCDLFLKTGEAMPFCSRARLRDALGRMKAAGYSHVTGLELEFAVLKVTDPRLDHGDAGEVGSPGAPVDTALTTKGFQYLTEARADELDPVFETVHRTCKALGLPLRSLEVEFGPSQAEVTFDPQETMATADATVLFRSAVKQALRRDGYHATFMCRPALPAIFSNGWHIHQSLLNDAGKNAFADDTAPLSQTGQAAVAGMLAHAAESCLLTTPTLNGYKRYRPFVLAPDRILWGFDNKGAMLRVVGGPGDKATRIENRAPEPAANPYLCMTSQVLSALDGIENGLEPPAASENPYGEGDFLPRNIGAAIDLFEESAFYRRTLGDQFVDYLVTIKRSELERFWSAVTDWEQREYFEIF